MRKLGLTAFVLAVLLLARGGALDEVLAQGKKGAKTAAPAAAGVIEIGELEVARRALEQRHAEVRLEAAYLMTHRGRCHVQLSGGACEARQPRGDLERAKRGQRRKGTGHL